MAKEKFKAAEAKYNDLHEKLQKGEISADLMKQELKRTMVQDDQGNYWMIGGKSGKWYKYDGKEWQESIPYQEEEEVEVLEKDDAFQDNQVYETQPMTTKERAFEYEQAVETQVQPSRQEAYQPEKTFEPQPSVSREELNREEHAFETQPVTGRDQGFGAQPVMEDNLIQDKASDFEQEIIIEVDKGESEETKLFDQQTSDETVRLDSPLEAGSQESPLDSISLDPAALETGTETADAVSRQEVVESVAEATLEEFQTKGKKKPKKQKKEAVKKPPRESVRGDEMVITGIDMTSLAFFLGGIGLIVGVLFGATFGIFTGVFGGLIDYFPEILQSQQGGLPGGLIFAAIGGIGGFILFALGAAVISSVYNLIAGIFGGIRFKIK